MNRREGAEIPERVRLAILLHNLCNMYGMSRNVQATQTGTIQTRRHY